MGARDRLAWQKGICSSNLPATARLAALAISLYSDPTGGQGVWLTSSDIAQATGIRAVTTVNTYLKMLKVNGWLRREDGAWFLTWPGELPLAAAAAAELAR